MLAQLKEIGETVQTFVGDDPALHGGLFLLGAASTVMTILGFGTKAIRWLRAKKATTFESGTEDYATPPPPAPPEMITLTAPAGTEIEFRSKGKMT